MLFFSNYYNVFKVMIYILFFVTLILFRKYSYLIYFNWFLINSCLFIIFSDNYTQLIIFESIFVTKSFANYLFIHPYNNSLDSARNLISYSVISSFSPKLNFVNNVFLDPSLSWALIILFKISARPILNLYTNIIIFISRNFQVEYF